MKKISNGNAKNVLNSNETELITKYKEFINIIMVLLLLLLLLQLKILFVRKLNETSLFLFDYKFQAFSFFLKF
jgi:hypothetical protein